MTPPPPAPAATAGSRFIVKFRGDSAPGRDADAARQRLEAMAMPGVSLAWQRRLGVGADLFTTSRVLDAAEAEALMQRLRDAPDVEYVEADRMMHIAPARPGVLPDGGD